MKSRRKRLLQELPSWWGRQPWSTWIGRLHAASEGGGGWGGEGRLGRGGVVLSSRELCSGLSEEVTLE